MPSESPTRMSSTPTSSMILAVKKSYAVSAAIFSSRWFIAPKLWMLIFCSFMDSPLVLHESNVPLAFRQLPKQHAHGLPGAFHNHVPPNCRQRQQHKPPLRQARMWNHKIPFEHFLLAEIQNIDVDRARGVLRQIAVAAVCIFVGHNLFQQRPRRALQL